MSEEHFGDWTVLERVQGKGMCRARCVCGKEYMVRYCDIKSGRSKRCRHHAKTALPGERFGSWTVLSRTGKKARCRCACGHTATVLASTLVGGGSNRCRSCGLKALAKRQTTHGKSRGRTYRSYRGMKERVAGRSGTKRTRSLYTQLEIEPDWKRSFEAFFADMGECPSGHSLDRIDGTRGYVRDNCRWADIRTQNQNRKRCIFVEYQGRERNLADVARESGAGYSTLYTRHKQGFRGDDLFNFAPRKASK